MTDRGILLACAAACAVLVASASPSAAGRRVAGDHSASGRLPEVQVTSQPAMYFSEVPGKTAVDTIDLMGPKGQYPYRGDFENAWARPGSAGLLPHGWYSVDLTAPPSRWHVSTYGVVPPLVGAAFWCGDIAFASCGAGDPHGGYGNNWREVLEFRKTVGAAATVRVQGHLVYDCEPGYDFITLQRRTAAHPDFEPTAGGQGLSWDGIGVRTVDYTFTYVTSELFHGTDVAVAFVFDSDDAWSDADCLWPTNGAARVDNLTVTVTTTGANAGVYNENCDAFGPDWVDMPNQGVGDFARVWTLLGDADDCASNYSNVVAFIDDGLVVPGTGGTVGAPGNDYGPPGGYIVNNTGGLLGPSYHIDNAIYSPIMTWPDTTMDGMSLAFDVYQHELLIPNDTPGIFYNWAVRTDWGDSNIYVPENPGPWWGRSFYYGGPNFLRSVNILDDLVVSNATQCQVRLGIEELGWQFGYGAGTNGTPAPYFDNVRVKIYPTSGPRIV
jgi:hypothetical protein